MFIQIINSLFISNIYFAWNNLIVQKKKKKVKTVQKAQTKPNFYCGPFNSKTAGKNREHAQPNGLFFSKIFLRSAWQGWSVCLQTSHLLFFSSETGNEISVVRGMAPRVDDTIGETKD